MNKIISKESSHFNTLLFLLLILPFFISTVKNSLGLLNSSKIGGDINKILNIIDFNSSSFEGGIKVFAIVFAFRILLYLLPFIIITFAELKNNSFKNTSLGRLGRSEGYRFADIWYLGINLLINRVNQITLFLTFGMSALNQGISNKFHNIYQSIFPYPNSVFTATLLLIIVLLINDFKDYANHWIGHKYPIFWDLHEFHHSASQMTILSQQRGFAIDGVLKGFFFIPITAFTGLLLSEYVLQGYLFPISLYILDSIMEVFFTYIGHSSLKLVYPKPLSYIYLSPSLHWLHHSINKEHWGCNLGEKYAIWDFIFGTYLDESHLDEIKGYGVESSEYNKHHPLYAYSLTPILKILKRIKKMRIFKLNPF